MGVFMHYLVQGWHAERKILIFFLGSCGASFPKTMNKESLVVFCATPCKLQCIFAVRNVIFCDHATYSSYTLKL